jgi:hypothetical protein
MRTAEEIQDGFMCLYKGGDKTDNEILAEFDGFQFHNDDPEQFPKGYYIHPEPGTDGHTADTLEYSTSWDWLMPVWYKFRDLGIDNLTPDEYEMLRGYWNIISLSIPLHPIASVFAKLVEAVKWYNTVKK